MDDARLAELAHWGRTLALSGDTAELRAAGRAIQMLVAEVEGLRPPGGDDDAPGVRSLPPNPRGEPQTRGDRDDRRRHLLRARNPSRRRHARFAVGAVAAAALLATSAFAARRTLAPELRVAGPPAEAALGPRALEKLTFVADADQAALRRQRWTLDGENITSRVRVAGARLVLVPGPLRDGEHRLTVAQGGGFLGSETVRTFRFVVDRKPPRIELSRLPATRRSSPLLIRGRADDAATIRVNGRRADPDDGRFSLRFAPPVPRALTLVAQDRARNTTRLRVPVEIVPRRPPVPVRAVHVTFYGWTDPALRRAVGQLIDQHRINAIELDLKDESGVVGFRAGVPLARRIGAQRPIVDLRSAVEQLHRQGIRVIGRLVCFRDPILAAAAWRRGTRGEVIQTPAGTPYAGYGGFTNFADPVVRRYNIDVATAAAALGVDDILYDYVRRPDGPLSSMVFPGLRGSAERSIVSFLAETQRALHPYRTFLGASVFGVAADRPREVAQLVPEMARHVDYIAPMVYPSHWAPGEYEVADPNAEPYRIVRRSLLAFQRDVRGSGARVVPWLQDFSLGVDYGPTEVRAQIDAAHADGIDEFLLWDPAVTYTAQALAPDAPTSKQGLARERVAGVDGR